MTLDEIRHIKRLVQLRFTKENLPAMVGISGKDGEHYLKISLPKTYETNVPEWLKTETLLGAKFELSFHERIEKYEE